MVDLKTCEIISKKKKSSFRTTLKVGKKKVVFIFDLPKESEEWYIADYYMYLKDNYRNIKKIGAPDYAEKNVPCVSFYFLSELLEQMLKPYPYIIGKGLTIHLKPFHDPEQEEVMHYYPHKSTRSNVYLGITWSYLIECIIHPYYHDQFLHTNRLGRTLLHEFVGHFGDKLTGLDKHQAKTARRLKGASPKLKILNEAIFDLRAEGYAHYLEFHGQETWIRRDWIKRFQNNMKKLLGKRTEKSMLKFYDEKLYSDDGVYHAGMAMCTTIALAKAKEKGVRIRTKPWRWSYNAWSQAKWMEVEAIPDKIHKEVQKEVSKCIYPVLFIRAYHNACDTLDIEPENRVLSQRDFFKLFDRAMGGDENIAKMCKKCPNFVEQYKKG